MIAIRLEPLSHAGAPTAARLCTACGLCCNGVLFHTVQLQPEDSAKKLAALGLKLKRKQGHHYILQPCPAFQESQCSIYAERPERCRLFECRQLKQIYAGETTEALALEKIREVQRCVIEVNELLQCAGSTNIRRPLSKRCEKIAAEPLSAISDPAAMELRNRLTSAMAQLNRRLNEEFRIVPTETAHLPAEN